jgi:hypothetical protein
MGRAPPGARHLLTVDPDLGLGQQPEQERHRCVGGIDGDPWRRGRRAVRRLWRELRCRLAELLYRRLAVLRRPTELRLAVGLTDGGLGVLRLPDRGL